MYHLFLALGVFVGNYFIHGIIQGNHFKGFAIGGIAAVITLLLSLFCLHWVK